MSRPGQMMVEIIIALGVFTFIASALTMLVFAGSSGFFVGSNQSQMMRLLDASVEELRVQKQQGWNTFVFGTSTHVYMPDGTWQSASSSVSGEMVRTTVLSPICRSGMQTILCNQDYDGLDIYALQAHVTIDMLDVFGRIRKTSTKIVLTNWDAYQFSQTQWNGGAGVSVLGSTAQSYLSSDGIRVTDDGVVELALARNTCADVVWDFANPAEYLFDPDVVSFVSSTVSMRPGVSSYVQKSWDFSDPTGYLFDAKKVRFHQGKASVQNEAVISHDYVWNFSDTKEYNTSGPEIISIPSGGVTIGKSTTDQYTSALYHFDETTGSFLDSSGNDNHLTAYGTPIYNQPGKFAASALFDTTGNDYASIEDVAQTGLDGMAQLTIEGWYKRTSAIGNATLVRKWRTTAGRSYLLHVTSGGSIRFYTAIPDPLNPSNTITRLLTTPAGSVPLDTWAHIAAVYDGAHMRVFVNGIRVGNLAATGVLNNGSDRFQIGESGNLTLSGFIDEVRISTVARWSENFTAPTAVFTDVPFRGAHTVLPVRSISLPVVTRWRSFDVDMDESPDTSIRFQFSYNGGDTWMYWTGSVWSLASSLEDANTQIEATAAMPQFTTSTGSLLVRGILQSFGTGVPVMRSMTVRYEYPSVDAAVVGLYHFDESADIFFDSSGNNNHLIPYGTPTYGQSGVFSSSTLFDVSGNDYARISDVQQSGLDGMDELTIDGWYRRVDTTTDAIFVRKWSTTAGRSYFVQILKNGSVRFSVAVQNPIDASMVTVRTLTTPANAVSLDTWTHIAAVYDGAWLRVFVNGIMTGVPVSAVGRIRDGVDPFQISNTGSQSLSGYIDEVRVSRAARWVNNFSVPSFPYMQGSDGLVSIAPVESLVVDSISHWNMFEVEADIMEDASIGFQISSDNGASWYVWDTSTWRVAENDADINTSAEIAQGISSFNTSTKQIRFRAIMSAGLSGFVSLDTVRVGYAVPTTDQYTSALYHFDETTGSFLDSSGNDNHLTAYGTPTYNQPGKFAASALFDTTGNDYASIEDVTQTGLDGMAQLTIEGWYKRTSAIGNATLVRKWQTTAGRSYLLHVTSGGAIRFYTAIPDPLNPSNTITRLLTTPAGSVPLDTWVHIAAVYDGAYMRVFVNGIRVGNLAATGVLNNGSDRFQIGESGNLTLSGFIDEVRISTVARWSENFTPSLYPYEVDVSSEEYGWIETTKSYVVPSLSQWFSLEEDVQSDVSAQSVRYQVSVDNGQTWLFLSPSGWLPATTSSESNTATEISSGMWKLPVGEKTIRLRARISDGVVLRSITAVCATEQFETGSVHSSGLVQDVVFVHTYARPVVVLSKTSQSNSGTIRLISVSSTGMVLDTSLYQGHVEYVVSESGVWDRNGLRFEAVRLEGGVGETDIAWRQVFSQVPVVFLTSLSGEGSKMSTADTLSSVDISGATVNQTEAGEVHLMIVEPVTRASVGVSDISVDVVEGGSLSTEECSEVSLPTTFDNSLSGVVFSSGSTYTSLCESASTSSIYVTQYSSTSPSSVGYMVYTHPIQYSAGTQAVSGYVGRGTLFSSAIDLRSSRAVEIGRLVASVPTCSPLCSASLFVRGSIDSGGMPGVWGDWYGPVGTLAPMRLSTELNGSDWIQYRLDLRGDRVSTPQVSGVRLWYR